MDEVGHIGFDVYFSKLPDPRISRKKLYPLIEILFVVLCGSICGAESWRDFVLFGESKIDLLKEYYPFSKGTLNDDVRLFLESEFKKNSTSSIDDTSTELDKGHGRLEMRHCIVSSQIDWLSQKSDWAGLKTIAMIEETCDIKGKISTERRFFISNLPPNASLIAQAVRAHWMVENNLHWTLDVVFNEDLSRVRKNHAGENMAIVRHIVINMLNKAKGAFKGVGLKALRKKAGWDNMTLLFILKQGLA